MILSAGAMAAAARTQRLSRKIRGESKMMGEESHKGGYNMNRRLLLLVALIYLIWPLDLMPGVPVDDIVVIVLSVLAQMERDRLTYYDGE